METTVHIDRVEITVHAPDKPLFLSLQQAAAESGLSASYLRKLIRQGQLPAFKGDGNNGHVHIKTAELVAFMETRRILA